jgi:DNA-binding PucR family transcriptional regulator
VHVRGLATAVIGGTLYAVLQTEEPTDRRGGLRTALDAFATKAAQALRARVVVGIGTAAAGIGELPLSRTTADRALRVVRWRAHAEPVAEYQDVQASALLLDFADAHRAEPALTNGPVTSLQEHDRVHRTAYLPTLRAYLDAFGDVDAAARALGVHVNTVRYRLRRLRSVAPIAIDDPTERLAIMLQMRLLGPDADDCPPEQSESPELGRFGQ